MCVQSLLLRRARADDAPALAELMSQLGYQTTPAKMAERLTALLPHPDFQTVVAEISLQVVGMVGVRRSPFYERDGSYGQIVALIVDATQRGQGIGSALLAAAERWMRDQRITVVIVNSGTARTEAHRFYEQSGYQATGVRYAKDLSG